MKKKVLLAAGMLLCVGSMLAQAPTSFGEPRLLLKASEGLMAPVWSPDGSQIAVTGDNFTGIYVANADGTGMKLVSSAPGAGYKMQWTSAQQIQSTPYTMVNNRRMVRVENVDVATGAISQVAAGTRGFKQSRALNRSNSVLQIMVDSPDKATELIPALNAYAGKMVINPVLSPDGSKIAFQVVGNGLMVCDADGSNVKTLGKGAHASWLPDGQHVMASRIEDNGHKFTRSDIYCFDVNTAQAVNITPETDAIPVTLAVSPDGKMVAFDNDVDGAIYVIDLNY